MRWDSGAGLISLLLNECDFFLTARSNLSSKIFKKLKLLIGRKNGDVDKKKIFFVSVHRRISLEIVSDPHLLGMPLTVLSSLVKQFIYTSIIIYVLGPP